MDSKIYNLKFVNFPPLDFEKDTIYVQKFAEENVGTTVGAAWVYVFDKKHNKEVALYKPLDYDEPLGAYAELFTSYLLDLCLGNDIKLRIPKIKLVEENNELGVLSYSVLDNVKEDLMHMDSFLFYKYKREKLKNFYAIGINDILECVKHEVGDEENFNKLKKAIIFMLLFDAFTNNVDRHGQNWGIVRDKDSNYYELAEFDNVKSFVNMFFNRPGYSDNELWAMSYNCVASTPSVGRGIKIVEFIKENYPIEFDDFLEKLSLSLEAFYSTIRIIKGVDTRRVYYCLKKKIRYFKKEEV